MILYGGEGCEGTSEDDSEETSREGSGKTSEEGPEGTSQDPQDSKNRARDPKVAPRESKK